MAAVNPVVDCAVTTAAHPGSPTGVTITATGTNGGNAKAGENTTDSDVDVPCRKNIALWFAKTVFTNEVVAAVVSSEVDAGVGDVGAFKK